MKPSHSGNDNVLQPAQVISKRLEVANFIPLKNTFGYKQGLSVEVDGTLCSDQGSSTFNGITEVAFECTGDLQGDVKIQRAADSYGFRCAIANETRMTCATSTSF